jgi:hypothetical protein
MNDNGRDWSATKRRLQQRWPGLPEEDLEASQGDRAALIGLLEGRLGYARENAEQDIDEILRGETIVPEDVADESSHTGTAGPVGPVSSATDFTSGGTRGSSGAYDAGERGRPSGGVASAQTMQGQFSGGYANTWADSRAGDTSDYAQTTTTGWSPKAIPIAAAAGTLLLVGIVMRKRSHKKRTKSAQVVEQARHLVDEISERMPDIEKLSDRIRPDRPVQKKRMVSLPGWLRPRRRKESPSANVTMTTVEAA